MDKQPPPAGGKETSDNAPRRGQFWPILLIIAFVLLMLNVFWPGFDADRISYTFFLNELERRTFRRWRSVAVWAEVLQGSSRASSGVRRKGNVVEKKADSDKLRYKQRSPSSCRPIPVSEIS